MMIWYEFHKYWTTAKKAVHVIRFEDLISNKREVISELLKFIFMVPSIEGTRLEAYMNLVLKEEAPQIYKPRKG